MSLISSTIREATKDDLTNVREFLTKRLPSSLSILINVQVTEKFQIRRKIYVSCPDPTLFIFATKMRTQPQSFCAFWDTERTTREDLIRYLKNIPDWSWDKRFFIFRVESKLASQLDEIIRCGSLTETKLRREFEAPCFSLQIIAENLPQIKLPDGFKIGELQPRHATYIMSFWDYGRGENPAEYEDLIHRLPSAAIYEEKDSNLDNPVSWAMVYNSGAFGMIHTLKEFRRLGLASAVLVSLSKKMLKAELPVTGDVETSNKGSVVMHQKLGFQIVTQINFNGYSPVKDTSF